MEIIAVNAAELQNKHTHSVRNVRHFSAESGGICSNHCPMED